MNTVNYSFKLGLRGLEHSQKKKNEKKTSMVKLWFPQRQKKTVPTSGCKVGYVI